MRSKRISNLGTGIAHFRDPNGGESAEQKDAQSSYRNPQYEVGGALRELANNSNQNGSC